MADGPWTPTGPRTPAPGPRLHSEASQYPHDTTARCSSDRPADGVGWIRRGLERPVDRRGHRVDRGDYPRAMTEYLALLDGSPSQDVIEAIALQTGELFKTTELTTDGGSPRFSPDGQYSHTRSAVVSLAARGSPNVDAPSKTIAELRGFRASFSPDGCRSRTETRGHSRRCSAWKRRRNRPRPRSAPG